MHISCSLLFTRRMIAGVMKMYQQLFHKQDIFLVFTYSRNQPQVVHCISSLNKGRGAKDSSEKKFAAE
jgi:hypothetical protein